MVFGWVEGGEGGVKRRNDDFWCGMRSLPMEKREGDAVNITGRDIVSSAGRRVQSTAFTRNLRGTSLRGQRSAEEGRGGVRTRMDGDGRGPAPNGWRYRSLQSL